MSMAKLAIPQPTFFHSGAVMSVNCEKKGTVNTVDELSFFLTVCLGLTFSAISSCSISGVVSSVGKGEGIGDVEPTSGRGASLLSGMETGSKGLTMKLL